MSNHESQLFDLIERWEISVQQGRELPVEQLCADCPQLADDLRTRISALRATAWMQSESELPAVPEESRINQVGRYLPIEKIGSGGFAEAWKAHDPQLDRIVAIKVPKNTPKGFHSENFLDEARKAARLKHPNIVSIFDVGQDGDRWFIVTEYMPNGNLAELLEKRKPTFTETVRLVSQVGRALHEAHQQGFIHRDVKPQNILIDENGNAKLADFGVALSEAQPVAQRSRSAGTIAYMSPEQGQNQTDKIDHRTDIYGLGVVLYQLLTGRLPFNAEDPMELWSAVVSQAPRTPRTIDHAIPVDLEKVCLKALSKKPEDRYSTAMDFANDLGNWRERKHSPRIPILVAALIVMVPVTGYISLRSLWPFADIKRKEISKNLSEVTEKLRNNGLGVTTKAVVAEKKQLSEVETMSHQLAEIEAEHSSPPKKSHSETSSELATQAGFAALNRGELETAKIEFTKAIELDERNAKVWHGRGVAKYNGKAYQDAAADLKQSLNLDNRSPDFFRHYAYALVKSDKYDEAVKQILFGQAKTSLMERAEFNHAVAEIYDARATQRIRTHFVQGAFSDLDESIKWDSHYAEAYHDRGSLFFNQKKFEEALKDFDKAIELDSSIPEYHLHRGYALKALRRN